MVSEVFVTDLSKTRLRKGDIVLAVNGIPIWKPEQADEAQLRAAREMDSLVLYCVDMEAFRDYIYAIVSEASSHVIQKESPERIAIDVKTQLALNYKTQLMEDVSEAIAQIALGSGAYMVKNKNYERGILAMHTINELIKSQLLLLKKTVVSRAWEYSLSAEVAPVYTVPSAPIYPAGSPVEVEIVVSDIDDSIPTATAVVIDL